MDDDDARHISRVGLAALEAAAGAGMTTATSAAECGRVPFFADGRGIGRHLLAAIASDRPSTIAGRAGMLSQPARARARAGLAR